MFVLGQAQFDNSVPAEPRIFVDTPAPHPNWMRFDETHDGVWRAYVVRFEDGGFYVGHTGKPLETRLQEHWDGKSVLTKTKAIRDTVYELPVSSRTLAQQVEASMKQLLERLGYRVLSM